MKQPPRLQGAPLVRSLFEFKRDRLGVLMRAAAHEAPVVRIGFGPIDAYLVHRHEDVGKVLAGPFGRYSKRTPPFEQIRKVIGEGLFTSDGETWKTQRRRAQPVFRKQYVDALSGFMAQAALDAVSTWQPGPLDISEEMMSLTLRVVSEAMLGYDTRSDTDGFSDALHICLEHTDTRMNDPFTAPEWIPTAQNRKFHRALRTLDAVVERVIAERVAGEVRDDLLQRLFEAEDEESGERMTASQLRDEVMTLLLAGHETSAVTLTWALHLLSIHPEIRAAVEAEVDAVCGSEPITLAQVMQLHTMDRVLRETLRLYPPVWGFTRKAEEADELSGYRIPRGALLFVVAYAAHRDPEIWPEPDRFNPDRFLPEPTESRPRFCWFPFGAGQRKCIGERFAMLEMRIVLATILQRFQLDPTPDAVVTPALLLTLRPAENLILQARARHA